MPVLEKACCCWPLHIGTSVIGWIGILFGVLLALFYTHLYLIGYLAFETRNFSLCLFSCFMYVTLSVFMLKGVLTKNRNYLVPWIMSSMLLLVTMNVTGVLFVQNTLQLIHHCLVLVILDFGGGYVWLWVFSYYQQLEKLEKSHNLPDSNVQAV